MSVKASPLFLTHPLYNNQNVPVIVSLKSFEIMDYSKFYNLVVFVLFVCIIDDVCLGIDIFHCKSKWSISELWIMYSITPRAMTSLCWFLIFYSFSSHLAGGQGRSSRPPYLNSYELNNQIFISWLGTWIKNVW